MSLLSRRSITALLAPRRLAIPSFSASFHRAYSTHAYRTPLLLTHSEDIPVLFGGNITFQDAIEEAKKAFYLPQKSSIQLVMKLAGFPIALTESSWGELEDLVDGEKWIELEVEVIDQMSKLGKAVSGIDEAKEGALGKMDKKVDEEPIAVQSTENGKLSEPKSSLNTLEEVDVAPVKSTALDPATSLEKMTSLRIKVVPPCGGITLQMTCNPNTTTHETVTEVLLKQYESHDPLKCHARGEYCSRQLEIRFLEGQWELADGTTVAQHIRERRYSVPYATRYRQKSLEIKGLSFRSRYSEEYD